MPFIESRKPRVSSNLYQGMRSEVNAESEPVYNTLQIRPDELHQNFVIFSPRVQMSFVNPGWGFLVVGSMRKGKTVLGILWHFGTRAPEVGKKFVSKMRLKGQEIELCED